MFLLPPSADGYKWLDKINCKGRAELFTADNLTEKEITLCKALCALCEARGPCIKLAFTTYCEDQAGVWGGLTKEERDLLVKNGISFS